MWFEELTFGQLIDRAAERWPDREALWFEGRRWTFAEQRAEIDRAAKALIAAGVRHGDHVCLWLGNSPEHVFLFFAESPQGRLEAPGLFRIVSIPVNFQPPATRTPDDPILFITDDEFVQAGF